MKKLLFVFFMFFVLLSAFSAIEKDRVMVLEIKAEIDPVMNRYVELALTQAKDDSVDLVIVDMDTYGGAVTDADEIRTRFLEFDIPVYVFINKNAGSAGSLISISCDSIYMAKGSSFGASTVVNQEGQVVPEKYQSFMRSKMRATAEAKGRNPEIAEAMVGLYLESDSAKVIAFTTKEAIENNYCEGEVESIEELLKEVNVVDYDLTTYKRDQAEKIIAMFLNPFLKSILLMIIMGGIFFELKTPGVGFPLLAAGLALILYFLPDYLHGLLDNWEFIVFLLGVILIVLEVAVIPGFGIAGIAGMFMVFVSLLLSMLNNDYFDFTFVSMGDWTSASAVVAVGMICGILFLIFAAPLILKTSMFQRVALSTSIEENSYGTSKREMIGAIGSVFTVLRPSGKVIIDGDIYDAYTSGGFIEKDSQIKVIEDNGASLKVKEIKA